MSGFVFWVLRCGLQVDSYKPRECNELQHTGDRIAWAY
jgi:hypothetical protein